MMDHGNKSGERIELPCYWLESRRRFKVGRSASHWQRADGLSIS